MLLNREYDRMGYFTKGGRAYSGIASKTPTLPKRYAQYCGNPITTGFSGFGVDLVTTKGECYTLCIDVDDHESSKAETQEQKDALRKETSAKIAHIVRYMAEAGYVPAIEYTEANAGAHLWFCFATADTKEKLAVIVSGIDRKVLEVYPDFKKGTAETNRFMRLPGLHKDGVSKSFTLKDDGSKVYLDTREAIDAFFASAVIPNATIIQVAGLISQYAQEVGHYAPIEKKVEVAKQATDSTTSKYVPCEEYDLTKLVAFVEKYPDVFVEGKEGHYNFNSNEALVLCEDRKVVSLLSNGKETTLATDIMAGLDRLDHSNEEHNSFVRIDKYEHCGLVRSVAFYRNRDNAGVTFFESSLTWSIDDIIVRIKDIPQLEMLTKHIFKEVRFHSGKESGRRADFFFTYDFEKEVELSKPYRPAKRGEEATYGRKLIMYIKRHIGNMAKVKAITAKASCLDRYNAICDVAATLYAGPFEKIFDDICNDTYQDAEEMYGVILRMMNLDVSKTNEAVVRANLEILFKKAAERSYAYLPEEEDLSAVKSKHVTSAIKNRIKTHLGHAAMFIGATNSGKTWHLVHICNGISNAIGINDSREDTQVHDKMEMAKELKASEILTQDGRAFFTNSPCIYFTEFGSKSTDSDEIQNTIVGLLSSTKNGNRFLYSSGAISSLPLNMFCGLDSDKEAFLAYKAGNAKRFLPIALAQLPKDTVDVPAEQTKAYENAVSYLVRMYIKELMVERSHQPFKINYTAGDTIEVNRALVEGSTKVNSVATTAIEYLKGSHTPGTARLKPKHSSAFAKESYEAYKDCSHVWIVAKDIAGVLSQFNRWHNPSRAKSVENDSQEVNRLAAIFNERGIKKVCVRGADGTVVKAYEILFWNPLADSESEETKTTEQIDIN